MSKKNDELSHLQQQIVHCIEKAESIAHTEWVVAVVPQSEKYYQAHILSGLTLFGTALITLLFIPVELHEEYILLVSVLCFGIGFFVSKVSRWVTRLFIGKKNMQKTVELHALASFQKSNLHYTTHRNAVLFYFSFLEKQAVIVADRGIRDKFSVQAWQELELRADKVFDKSYTKTVKNIIEFLKQEMQVFAQYLPVQQEYNLNEIPNQVTIL
jgi:uncharacterized membrane protein